MTPLGIRYEKTCYSVHGTYTGGLLSSFFWEQGFNSVRESLQTL